MKRRQKHICANATGPMLIKILQIMVSTFKKSCLVSANSLQAAQRKTFPLPNATLEI